MHLLIKKLKLDIFARIPSSRPSKQTSPLGSYHHPQVEGNCSSPQATFYQKSISTSIKEERKLWNTCEWVLLAFRQGEIHIIFSAILKI